MACILSLDLSLSTAMISLLRTLSFLLLAITTASLGQGNRSRPVIIGQTPSPLVTQVNQPITLELVNLIVVDADPSPVYPTGFSLDISNGDDYDVRGTTITPDRNFTGRLNVAVRVNDGRNDSKKFDIRIDVVKAQNAVPQITAQKTLEINEDQEITLQLSQLTVVDADNDFPDDFNMDISSGDNYTVSGSKIIPARNFAGVLSVPVKVNDGTNDSPPFNMQITVKPVNDTPEITGQVVLSIAQNSTLSIELNHLIVADPDNKYPDDFSLKTSQGNNYTVSGNTITPRNNFTGELLVKVTVNDGRANSESFDLKVQINENTSVPEITGQTNLSIKEDESITLQLSHLSVKGGRNGYPNGFTLIVSSGEHYVVNGVTITPALNYSGALSVNVKVTDGEKESAPFKLQISVNPVNDLPLITGQVPLSTDQNKSIPLELSNLKVTDPDNNYPTGFTMEISGGANYSVAGKSINPSPTFTGLLEVGVTVNDGLAASNLYKVKINVISTNTNVPPVITAQKAVSITQNSEYLIKLSDITVSDPNNDKKYPDGYSLNVLPGNNYTVRGTTVKPISNFSGNSFTVRITVSDGQDTSTPFDFKIGIVPPSSIPKINGQLELTMFEDSTHLLTLSDLIVTDADNLNYPEGFSLTVLPGNEEIYTAVGHIIKPALNLNGYIEVSVSVSDGVNPSQPFNVSILVIPVNDPPEIINLEQTPLSFEPGNEPINISERIDLSDSDNEYLSMAEIGFRPVNHSMENDELIFNNNDSSKIRSVYDPKGILFLIGYATIDDYRDAIRTIQYNYKMTQDGYGNPSEILSGTRTLYIYVHDGQYESLTHERKISMETKVQLDIPTAFTPNGDKANDTWRVQATNKDQLDKCVIRIYDKRGVLLYEAIGFNEEWDGILNGKVLPMDTYYYTIDLNLPYMKKTYKGAVTILH